MSRSIIYLTIAVLLCVAMPVMAKQVKDYTLLNVNGQEITRAEVMVAWEQLFSGKSIPDFDTFDQKIKENVLRGIVGEKLLYTEALSAKTDQRKDIQQKLEQLKRQLIIQSFIEKKAENLVSQAALKQAYASYEHSMKGQFEVRARHILVDKKEKADDLIKTIKKGEKFETVAKAESIDTLSGSAGGDLGYFTQGKMVPAFSKVAFALKKGDISQPTKTEFGWHIIRLEDKRPIEVASFEEKTQELRQEIQRKSIEGYVEGLLKKADVTYLDAAGKALPFSLDVPKAPKGQ